MSEHGPISRRNVLKIGALAGAGAVIRFEAPTLFQSANASVSVPQTALPGASVSQFTTPVPTYFGKRVSGASLQSYMYEFQQNVLPDSFYRSLSGTYHNGTWLWGYATGPLGSFPSPQWPGATVEVKRGTPVTVRIGVDSGVVAVGPVDARPWSTEDIAGDPPNIASRVQATAERMTARVTDATNALIDGWFETLPVGPVELRNYPEPVGLHRVIGPTPLLPAQTLSHISSTVSPSAVTTPIPVMTTRRLLIGGIGQ